MKTIFTPYRAGIVCSLTFLYAMPAFGADFYVSPSGLATGTGSISSPWDLRTALNHPSAVRPGDTIWLRGGTYSGQFRSELRGTATAPIIVRPYQQERAILDGAMPTSPSVPMQPALTVSGLYTWFWGLEITNSGTRRSFNNSECFDRQFCRGAGIDVFGPGTKIINCVVHDTGDGIGLWAPATDAEAYGNVVYNNGWQSEVRGSGHAMYVQNGTGVKRIADNTLLNGFHSGIHVYGSASSQLRNVVMEGNSIFNTGVLASDPNGWGILVGGNVLADTITVSRNYLWNPSWHSRSSNLNPSWGSYGTTRLTATNNHSWGPRSIEYSTAPTNSTVSGNIFYGSMNTVASSNISATSNTIASAAPSTVHVYIRPNQYEPDLSTITVFNPGGSSTVAANLSSVLAAGANFEIRDVQNLYGAPVMTGTYNGGSVSIPMTNNVVAQPIGVTPRSPAPTGTTFGVFRLRRLSGTSSQPPPPPSPSPSPSTANCVVNAVCEAESGVLESPMSSVSSSSASGGAYLRSATAEAGTVTLTFDVSTTQMHGFWMRLQASSSSRDSFWVSLDGGPEGLFELGGSYSSSYQWQMIRLRQSPTAPPADWLPTLSPGRHTIRIRAREAYTRFDALAVTNNPSYHP